MTDCWVWLYRGAWHEWDSHEIEMAVPLSPEQVLRKRRAIFYHQSQNNNVMFQGDDEREFWQRVSREIVILQLFIMSLEWLITRQWKLLKDTISNNNL